MSRANKTLKIFSSVVLLFVGLVFVSPQNRAFIVSDGDRSSINEIFSAENTGLQLLAVEVLSVEVLYQEVVEKVFVDIYAAAQQIVNDAIVQAQVSTTNSSTQVRLNNQSDTGRNIDPNLPMIALTFDDGPAIHTIRILETLESNGGRGTFFVIGQLLERGASTAISTRERGHDVFGHSWDHSNMTHLSTQALTFQILGTHEAIEELIGETSPVFRPPFGAYDQHVREVARELGFAIINWSIDPQDWLHRNADVVYSNIINGAHDGGIVVLHDIHAETAAAMDRVIPSLVERGYQLVTLSELFYYRGVEVTAGTVINSGN